MDQFLTHLSRAVEGAPAVALAAAALWGVLSIVLSPCHLASIPLIVGFVSGQPDLTRRRAFTLSSLFGVGILVTIAAVGALTATLGRMLGDVGPAANYLVAAVFFVFGLHLLDALPLPFAAKAPEKWDRRGLLAAFLLGLLFGIALGPCTFAFMAPMLAVTFKAAGSHPLHAAGLLLAFGAGHCAVLVVAGASAETVQRYLRWNAASRGPALLKKACGVLVLLGGLYLLYTAR